MKTLNLKKRLQVSALAFAYAATSVAPAMADDSEIYLGASAGGAAGGVPNVLMLLDTSGSMLFPMYNTYPTGHPKAGQAVPEESCQTSINTLDCAKFEDDRRSRHLLNAVKRILENLDGNIRVGIARYNSNSDGGRVIYPVRRLADSASTATTEDRTYQISARPSDADQEGSTGSNIRLDSTYLPLGNRITSTAYSQTTYSNQLLRAENDLQLARNVNNGTFALGGYANSGGEPRASVIGLKYVGLNIPDGAAITKAELKFEHSTNSISNNSDFKGPKATDNGAFSFTLSLQDQPAPNDYSDSGQNRVTGSSRTYAAAGSTTVSVSGTELTSSSPTKVVDITSLLQAKANASGWGISSDLAIKLAGTAQYTTGAKNGRRIKIPTLEIQYAPPGTTYTGLRFMGVDIPRGATINSAELRFVAANAATGSTQFEIKADPAVAPLEFSAIEHLDATRWNGGATSSWSVGNWSNGNTYAADVKTLLQAHVNNTSFCGGLGIAFRIRQTSSTSNQRFVHSYDGYAAQAPRLVVNYTLPAVGTDTCLRASRIVSVRSGSDDGVSVSGTDTLTALSAELRDSTNVGLRFANLAIPQGAVIRDVTLKLKAANSADNATKRGSFTVNGVKLANVDTFGTGNTIGSLLTSATTASQNFVPAAWSKDSAYEFSDTHTGAAKANTGLVGIIQEIVDQSTWASGNGIALLLKGSRNSAEACWKNKYPCLYQADQGSSSAATLVVYYESNNAADGVKTVRQDLMALMDTMVGTYYGGGTPMGESAYEAALYMVGGAPYYGKGSSYTDSKPAQNAAYTQYLSPVDGGICQSNNIIMLTDGAPSNDDGNKTLASGGCSGSWDCMKKTAAQLKSTGFTHGSPAQRSYISTYTIGFGPEVNDSSSAAYTGLAAVAASGGGEFFPASDVDSLVSSFETIFARLADTNGTMASPGVAVNQLNRTQHLDQLYYGVFKPQTTRRWPGNLKRYRLDTSGSTPQVVDVDDRPAISTSTKYFDANAKSWWGTTTDGNEAAKGGAAEQLTTALNVYTDNPANNAMSLLDAATPPTGMTASDVNWARGYDVDGTNGQGPSGFRQSMGSPMHAQPTMLAQTTSSRYTVFVGTNDGMLHAINNANGKSYWAWLPSDLQGNIAALRNNSAMGSGGLPIYGLDGSWSMVAVSGQPNQRLLVGGLRQGGSNYYALKVNRNPAVAPQLSWAIRPSTSTEFARLGRTWSQPQAAYVRISGQIKSVVIFGGGLDFSKYEAGAATQAASGTDLGNAVYMVDAETGSLLWWASSSATTGTSATKVTAMKYSIPGGVRVLDKNGDGLADHLYFGDVGGQIFRADLNNLTSASKLVKRVALLAQLGNAETVGKANDRRFYETPAVEYVFDSNNKLYAAVTIGSGDRTFPKSNQTTEDRFYVIRDYDAARFDILLSTIDEAGTGSGGTPDLATKAGAFTTSDLANLTATFGSAATTAVNAKKGWWIKLPATGEKVLSSPFIFSRKVNGKLEYQVNFNSFVPDSVAASGCSPVAGSTSAWSVLLDNATPVSYSGVASMSDRYTEGVAVGITGSGVPMVVDKDGDGQGDTLIELTGTGAQDRGAIPAGLGKIQRTRWYDKRAN